MKIRGTTITTPIARSAVADDKSVSNKPWSSKNTVDKLCPTFTESGSVVVCEPVEGYPLEVVSHIAGGRSQNLITDYGTNIDDYSDPTIAVDLPAGKYFLWYKGESGLRVSANTEDNELVFIPASFDEAKETTIDHPGGFMLIADTDWMTDFNESNLVLTAVTGDTTSVTLTHNGKTVTVDFPVAVSRGTFNWVTGELTTVTGQPNLVADYKDDSKWRWNDPEAPLFELYEIPDLPSGSYVLFSNEGSSIDVQAYDEELGYFGVIASTHGSHVTFKHYGGVLQLWDISGSRYDDYFVLKLVEGTEFVEDFCTTHQLTPHEIIGFAGTNTLSSSTGDTEVSGRADPNSAIQDLNAKVNELTATINALINGEV